jgi:Pvc16 N-terminal domain
MAAEDALKRLTLNLAELLHDRMFRTDVAFSFGAPHPIADETGPRLNIFLYQINENPAFRNDEDPRRAVSGSFGSPPLALELGYLFTSYGRTTEMVPAPPIAPLSNESLAELDAQFVLADAMRVLHDVPIVSRKTQRQRVPGGVLLDPGLQTEFESLRIAPRGLNLDELSKLWTALKDDFQRSVAYEVSVMRIEQRKPSLAGGPVLNRTVTAQPTAVLGASLNSIVPELAAATVTITLVGSGLGDPTLQVLIADALASGFPDTPQTLPVFRDALGVHFQIPNDPAHYMPGPKLVTMQTTITPGHTVGSNAAVLRLLPAITGVLPNPPQGLFDGTVTVTLTGNMLGLRPAGPPPPPGTPPIVSPWTPTLLFGSYAIPVQDIDPTGLPGTLKATLQVPDPANPHAPVAGQVLPIRVRVNGVESQCWKVDPATQKLVMDPNLLFTVT